LQAHQTPAIRVKAMMIKLPSVSMRKKVVVIPIKIQGIIKVIMKKNKILATKFTYF